MFARIVKLVDSGKAFTDEVPRRGRSVPAKAGDSLIMCRFMNGYWLCGSREIEEKVHYWVDIKESGGNLSIYDFISLIGQWHYDRNLIKGSDDKSQFAKLVSEVGELGDNICKQKDIDDDIGDCLVVLINIMIRNNLTMEDCLQIAWESIKDRNGKMVDGVFVKEADL